MYMNAAAIKGLRKEVAHNMNRADTLERQIETLQAQVSIVREQAYMLQRRLNDETRDYIESEA